MDIMSQLRGLFGGGGATSYAAPQSTPLDLSGQLQGIGNSPAVGGQSLGLNVPTAQLGLSALGTAGGLWNAFQTQRMAQDQFKFSKNLALTNLANQTQSYNTALTDRITARAATQGMSGSDRDAYIAQHRL